MFSLDLMTAPTPLQMAVLSSQPMAAVRPWGSWRGWEGAWDSVQEALTVLTSIPLGPAPAQKHTGLFPGGGEEEEALLDTKCLIATAVITLFNVSNVAASVK